MNPTIGKIEQLTTTPTQNIGKRSVQIVKSDDMDYQQRRAEINLLKILMRKHKLVAKEWLDVCLAK